MGTHRTCVTPEQPNEALALVDQRLGEHGHADRAQRDLRLHMLDEQQACRVHRDEPCAPDPLARDGTAPARFRRARRPPRRIPMPDGLRAMIFSFLARKCLANSHRLNSLDQMISCRTPRPSAPASAQRRRVLPRRGVMQAGALRVGAGIVGIDMRRAAGSSQPPARTRAAPSRRAPPRPAASANAARRARCRLAFATARGNPGVRLGTALGRATSPRGRRPATPTALLRSAVSRRGAGPARASDRSICPMDDRDRPRSVQAIQAGRSAATSEVRTPSACCSTAREGSLAPAASEPAQPAVGRLARSHARQHFLVSLPLLAAVALSPEAAA